MTSGGRYRAQLAGFFDALTKEDGMPKDNVHTLRDGEQTPEEELEAERARLAAEEKAADTRAQEEADGQFALEIPDGGRKINLGTIIPRGTAVEVKYKMSGKPIPNVKGGIMDPADISGLLLASRVVEGVNIRFVRDGDLKIEKATVDVVIGTRNVVNAHSEAGELLLRGDAEAA